MKQNISKIVYPLEFQSRFVVCVSPLFIRSFEKILEGSGRKEHVVKMLEQRLRFLEERKHEAYERSQWIKKLSWKKGMYCLRIADKDLNIRIPFVFHTYQGRTYAVLLSAFLEKNKASAKKNSYAKEFTLIEPVINELEEVFRRGIQND